MALDFSLIEKSLKLAKERNERRMFFLSGLSLFKLNNLEKIAEIYLKNCNADPKALFIWRTGSEEKKVYENLSKKMKIQLLEFKDVDTILGTNYDFVVVDLSYGISPNDLGKITGIVKGNGILVFLAPSLSEFEKMFTKFHEMVLVDPFTKKDIRHIFNRWFVKKMKEHCGIFLIENNELLHFKECEANYEKQRKEKVEFKKDIPENLKNTINLCATMDQINAIFSLLEFLNSDEKAFILTAHRGRGKSALLGIFLSHILKEKKIKVVITSLEKNNVLELAKFLKKGLEKDGFSFSLKKFFNGDKIKLPNGASIRYALPFKALRKKADLIVVDEAASIPVNILFQLLKKEAKVIYSTTIHGYEGSGRSFNLRFLKSLKEKNVPFKEFNMIQPIRYSETDPIEKWLFDVLLLDVEVPEIKPEEVDLKNLRYVKPDIESLVFENEKLLREMFAVFVTAHYRNNPNDFGFICDAPHHEVRILLDGKGRVVCSLQIAKEGMLERKKAFDLYYGETPSGNLIPDRLIKHYRDVEFGTMRGYRIVRIAVHPNLMGMGIGSIMLKHLEKEAKKESIDWLGASFGSTEKLLNFWFKNEFFPIHIAPVPNPKTGEHSVIVLKGVSENADKKMRIVQKEFIIKLLNSLVDPFNSVPATLILKILKSYPGEEYKPLLSETQWKRVCMYAFNILTFETCRDCVFELAKSYFLSKDRAKISREHELLLILKVLQAKTWKEVKDILGKGQVFWMIELKDLTKTLVKHFGKGKVKDEEIKKLEKMFEKIKK